jgi:schlafen family protein
MPQLVDRALAARRESRRIEFKSAFDAGSTQYWCEIVKDIVAIANSGGGVILFGVDNSGRPTGGDVTSLLEIDPAAIADQIHRYSDSNFADFEVVETSKESNRLAALVIENATTPIVFSRPGAYTSADGKQKCAFSQGTLYFRHGAKSEPGTTADVDDAIKRRVNALRRSWLSAVKRVVEAPTRSSVAVLPSEIRDSDSLEATPIRVVRDPRAPAFRLVDYDKTHPFRQKEVLAALRSRLSDMTINQFDLQAIRHVYNTDASVDFAHKPVFGTRQYSAKFIDWLVEQVRVNPGFFASAREQYIRTRRTAS